MLLAKHVVVVLEDCAVAWHCRRREEPAGLQDQEQSEAVFHGEVELSARVADFARRTL